MNKRFDVTCDNCRRVSVALHAPTVASARKRMQRAGWSFLGATAHCHECPAPTPHVESVDTLTAAGLREMHAQGLIVIDEHSQILSKNKSWGTFAEQLARLKQKAVRVFDWDTGKSEEPK